MITAVILAAGRSTRFPDNKLLKKLGGKALIEIILERFLRSKVDRVIVVVGWQAERLVGTVRAMGAETVYNEGYEEGMSSSVRVGVRAALNSEAVIIHPADVPFIGTKTIDKVVESYINSRRPIVVAGYGGRLGHPILFDGSLIPEILHISEETMGLKAVVSRHRDKILIVETEPACLFDVDRPDDLRRVVEVLGLRDCFIW